MTIVQCTGIAARFRDLGMGEMAHNKLDCMAVGEVLLPTICPREPLEIGEAGSQRG